jgi:hypothetical protein
MKRFTVVSLCILALAVFAQIFASPPKRQEARVAHALHSPKIPLEFNDVSAHDLSGQGILNYSFKRGSGYGHYKTTIVLAILDAQGHVKGGQGWDEAIDLSSNPEDVKQVAISLLVETTDRIVVSIWRLEGEGIKIEIPSRELGKALRTGRFSQARILPGGDAQYVKASFTETDTCATNLALAKLACGCGGIKTFSCNPQTGAWSFECFPRNGCKDSGDDEIFIMD